MVKKSHFGDHTVINAGGFQMDNAEKVPYNLNLLFFEIFLNQNVGPSMVLHPLI